MRFPTMWYVGSIEAITRRCFEINHHKYSVSPGYGKFDLHLMINGVCRFFFQESLYILL